MVWPDVYVCWYQQDRVEAWLRLPLLELLLSWLQHRRVLAGGLRQGLQDHRTGTVDVHEIPEETKATFHAVYAQYKGILAAATSPAPSAIAGGAKK